MKIAGEKNIINKLITGKDVLLGKKKLKLPVRKIILARGALSKIIKIFDEGKFARPNINVAIVSDYNTHEIAGAEIERALCKKYSVVSIILPENIKADDESLKEVLCLSYGCKFIVGVGSGTINDLCKLASFRLGIDYGIFATAPSMNGYLSPTASIETDGVKTSLKAHLPKLAVFDLDILKAAPQRLIRAGFGDVICRSTVEADSLLSHYILGTKHNEFIFDFLKESEKKLLKEIEYLTSKNNEKAILALTKALIAGGVAMWLSGSSEPASQGEHMICHYIESLLSDERVNLHGEEVGVATLFMAKLQEKILGMNEIELVESKLKKSEFTKKFGPTIGAKFFKEYKKKQPESFAAANSKLAKDWGKLKDKALSNHLGYKKIKELLTIIGAKTKIEQLGWDENQFKDACEHAKFTRNRFTFLDI